MSPGVTQIPPQKTPLKFGGEKDNQDVPSICMSLKLVVCSKLNSDVRGKKLSVPKGMKIFSQHPKASYKTKIEMGVDSKAQGPFYSTR